MAPPKQKPAAKRSKPAAASKALADQLRRAARDPFVGPSSVKQIERSLDEGTRKTLAEFRTDIDWE